MRQADNMDLLDLAGALRARAHEGDGEDLRGLHVGLDVEGEEGFRARERVVIEELTRFPGVLLSTGGGSVLLEENRKCLQSRGTVIFLDTTVELQLERTRKDKNRPLLQIENPRGALTEMKNARDPLYDEVADLKVFAGDSGGRRTVTEILRRLMDEGYIRD